MTELENVEQVTKDLNEWLGEMPYFPNTEYITINKDGIFVGGKPATHYLGYEINSPEYIKATFKEIQNKYSSLQEIHILSSSTSGYRPPIRKEGIGTGCYVASSLRPSIQHGNGLWCRIKLNDGTEGIWAYIDWYGTLACCAESAADHTIRLLSNEKYASTRFILAIATKSKTKRTAPKKQNKKHVIHPETEFKQKLQGTDLSKLVGKPVQLNGYKIIVEKIAETKQNKR